MQIDLINSLANNTLSRKDKILLILFSTESEIHIKKIIGIAVANGIPNAKEWNVSQILSGLEGFASKLPNGWVITERGRNRIRDLELVDSVPTHNIKPALRNCLNTISNKQVKEFVEETITALEADLLRSAVVLSWAGAVSVLQAETLNNHIGNFNREAKNKFKNWKNASNPDDLAKMMEHDFLQVLESLSIIGKSVKNELESCLKLRNACSHPNSLEIAEHRVASHIEILILNVYSKFNI